MKLELEVSNDVQLRREILRRGARAQDARPAFNRISRFLRNQEARQFNSQGAWASGGWTPLKPGTVRQKAARGEDPRILHRSGRLRASLTRKTHPDHIDRSTRDELVFGTNVPYAKYHQRGTGRMPQRRPVELRERARESSVKMLQRFLFTGEVK